MNISRFSLRGFQVAPTAEQFSTIRQLIDNGYTHANLFWFDSDIAEAGAIETVHKSENDARAKMHEHNSKCERDQRIGTVNLGGCLAEALVHSRREGDCPLSWNAIADLVDPAKHPART